MNIDKILGKSRESNEIWVNEFTESSASEFREDLLEAAKGDPKRPIIVYIDSYGGQVDALASMIETMDEIPNPLITVAVGKAMSCGAALLSHGDIRFVGKHSRIMIHEVSGGTVGDVHDMASDAQEVKRLNAYFMGILAKNCNIPGGYEGLRKLIKGQDGRDNYLDAKAALKFGIVDAIGMPRVEKVSIYQVGLVPPKEKIIKAQDTNTPSTKKTGKKKTRR